MQIIKSIEDIQKHLNEKKKLNSLGFVPTMGALHKGHLSLIEQSQIDNLYTLTSIFVNPTQFNNISDFYNYPNTLDDDLDKLKQWNCNFVFIPSVDLVYPNGPVAKSYDFGGIENEMEGKFRPGHFNGVGTVLERLFDLIKPKAAYFGAKDFQQLQIAIALEKQLTQSISIIGCPIFRESDGLAVSSRNLRLTRKQRETSSIIFKTLVQVKKKFLSLNEISLESINSFVNDIFLNHSELNLEYFMIADEKNLKTISKTEKIKKNKKYRAFISIFANDVRLIDNIELY